jgi:RHS repeat-associated protein
MKQAQILIILLLSIVFRSDIVAQNCDIINVPATTHNYSSYFEARTKVHFPSGFSFKAEYGKSIHANINPSMVCQPVVTESNYPTDVASIQIDEDLEVGSIPYSSGVGSVGEFLINVPIDLPGGIRNFKPSISLNYSSNNSVHTSLGTGWSLGGYSYISRIGKDTYYDGKIEDVKLNSSDNLSINGEHLVLKAGSNLQVGAEYYYETYNQSLIVITDADQYGPKTIEVRMPNGSIITYGANDTGTSIAKNGVRYRWFVTSERNISGNIVEYEYIKDRNQIYLSSIKYGGNSATSLSHSNRVDFLYERAVEEKKFVGFEFGQRVHGELLLSSINIHTNGSLFSTYTVKYANEAEVYKLIEIDKQGHDGLKTNPLRFLWDGGSQIQSQEILDKEYILDNDVLLDVNNDGYQDIVNIDFNTGNWKLRKGSQSIKGFDSNTITGNIYNQNNGEISKDNNTISVSDLGMALVEDSVYKKTKEQYRYKKAYGGLWWRISDWRIKELTKYTTSVSPFDLTGDEKGDFLISFASANNPNKHKFLLYQFNPTSNNFHTPNGGPIIEGEFDYALGDFTGCGYAQMVYVIKGTNQAFLYDFVTREKIQIPVGANTTGLTRLFTFEAINSNNKSEILFIGDLYSSLVSFNDKTPYLISESGFPNKYHSIISSNDLTGDGLDDLLIKSSNSLSISKYDGISFTEENIDISQADIQLINNSPIYLADLIGDSKPEIIQVQLGSDINCYECGEVVSLDIFSLNKDNQLLKLQSKHIGNVYNPSDIKTIRFLNFDGYDKQQFLISYNRAFGSTQPEELKDVILMGLKPSHNKIKTVVDGTLNKTNVTYTELLRNQYLNIGVPSTENLLERISHPGLTVAKNITKLSRTNKELSNISYSFNGATYSKLLKSFIGFREITTLNNLNELKEKKVFSFHVKLQNQGEPEDVKPFPFVSTLQVSHTANSTTLNTVTTQLEMKRKAKSLALRSHFVFPSLVTETDHLKGFTKVTENKADTDGNIYSTKEKLDNDNYIEIFRQNFTSSLGIVNYLPQIEDVIYKRKDQPFQIDRSTYNYNSKDQLIYSYQWPNTPNQITTHFEYDDYGWEVNKTVTGNGIQPIIASRTFDESKQLIISSRNANGWELEYEYNPQTRFLEKMTDINDKVLTINSNSLLTQQNRVYPTTESYSSTLHWALSTNPHGVTFYSIESATNKPETRVFYSSNNQPILIYTKNFSGGWNVKGFKYDELGRIEKEYNPIALPSNKTPNSDATSTNPVVFNSSDFATLSYDEYGRQSERLYNGRSEKVEYVGCTTKYVLPEQTKQHIYNAWGDIAKAIDAGGEIVYTYNSKGKVIKQQFEQYAINYTYDDYGNMTKLNDPAMGVYDYKYDVLGRVIEKMDPNNIITTITYDNLGRIASETGPVNKVYSYDAQKLGLLDKVESNNHSNEITYDDFGRPIRNKETLFNQDYITEYTYQDNLLTGVKYPDGFELKYTYNTGGYLKSATNSAGSAEYIKINAVDAYGRVIDQTKFVGSNELFGYNFQYLTSHTLSGLINTTYEWDNTKGNLISRFENVNGRNLKEEFAEYDNLNRLTKIKVNGVLTNTLNYSNNGNITKSETASSYSYNANNSMLNMDYVKVSNPRIDDLEAVYNGLQKVESLKEGLIEYDFTYGFHENRIKMVRKAIPSNQVRETTIYGSNFEQITDSVGNTKTLTYLQFGGGTFAIHKKETAKPDSIFYTFSDHLGSITHITDQWGNLKQERSYDAWGNLRTPNNYAQGFTQKLFLTQRGYTGHEHIQNLEIINMNGRLYDPVSHRMMSPDPLLQDPTNTQNYNRYSYVFNNPLRHTDPSGYLTVDPGRFFRQSQARQEQIDAQRLRNYEIYRGIIEGGGEVLYPDYGSMGSSGGSGWTETNIELASKNYDSPYSIEYSSLEEYYTALSLDNRSVPVYGYEAISISGTLKKNGKESEVNTIPTLRKYLMGFVDMSVAQNGGGYSNFDLASDIVGGFGLGVDLGAYRWGNFSNRQQWKSSYKTHQYLKGKGYNIKTSTIKNAIPKGLKATGTGLGIVSGAITVGDALYNSELNASHILDATITGVSFIPGFGWAIGGGYFVGDMIHRGVYGYSIGDRLDNAVGGSIYNWDW